MNEPFEFETLRTRQAYDAFSVSVCCVKFQILSKPWKEHQLMMLLVCLCFEFQILSETLGYESPSTWKRIN